MNTRCKTPGLVLAAGLLLCTQACLSVDAPLPVRTFHPGQPDLAARVEGAPAALRLDRVEAAPLLRERMVWHLSDVELTFDELSRWAAPPAELVAEALRAALFEAGHYADDELASRELAIRVTAFDGDLTGDTPRAHVRLVATLRSRATGAGESAVFDEHAPLTSNDPADLARGVGQALARATTRLRAWLGESVAPEPAR